MTARYVVPPDDIVQTPVPEVLSSTELDGDGPLTQQVYRLLRILILNLRLMPNQPLPEYEVAASLSVSKTPVREALIRLAEDRLVIVVPKIGSFVAPIDIKRAFHGYFIRESLESACLQTLARGISAAGMDRLETELALQKTSVDRGLLGEFYILDNQFHDSLFLAAGMMVAKKVVDKAKVEVDRIKGLKASYRFCRPEEVLYQEHLEMVEAIRRGDTSAGRTAIRDHLSGMNDAIWAMLKEERLWHLFARVHPGQRTAERRALPDMRHA